MIFAKNVLLMPVFYLNESLKHVLVYRTLCKTPQRATDDYTLTHVSILHP